MSYENKHQPLLSYNKFIFRIVKNILYGVGLCVLSLVVGSVGYYYFAELSWVDAFENASMILSGMGPVTELHTTSAKLFASIYALFSGIVFLVIIAILFMPLYHRFMHKFHLKEN